jgi:hypothetical protein
MNAHKSLVPFDALICSHSIIKIIAKATLFLTATIAQSSYLLLRVLLVTTDVYSVYTSVTRVKFLSKIMKGGPKYIFYGSIFTLFF